MSIRSTLLVFALRAMNLVDFSEKAHQGLFNSDLGRATKRAMSKERDFNPKTLLMMREAQFARGVVELVFQTAVKISDTSRDQFGPRTSRTRRRLIVPNLSDSGG